MKSGSEKGSQKGFWEKGFQKVPTPPQRVRPLRCATYKLLRSVSANVRFGNFRPGPLSPKPRFLGMRPVFLSDVLCWGKNHPYWKICREIDVNLSLSFLLICLTVFISSIGHLPKHCTGHLLMLIAWIKVWMAVSNLTHSKQKVDVCRFVWFSVRSLFCKSLWADSGDFQAETQMRRLLGKVGRVFVRVGKKTVIWENSSDFRWEA